jgi:serine protease Do
MNVWPSNRSGMLLGFLTLFFVIPFGCESKGSSQTIGFPQSFADLAEKTTPAAVNISTTATVKVPGNPFRHFFGSEEDNPLSELFKHYHEDLPDREMKQQSLGSGFIISKDGYIITNNHMVDGSSEIKVKISDGRELKAKVVGRDSKTDLALLKISSLVENLPVLALGDSEKTRVGDWVLAVGNPFGLEHTVTQGIISATGRVIGSGPYDNFLQTDAPINPGNSGGPLINLRGEVIGINTAIFSGGQGIGFAIPSSVAKLVITQLKAKGRVVRGWIGVSIQTVTPEIAKSFGLKEVRGALVGDVVPGGPAAKGGIKQGDVIVSFAGHQVKNANDLPRLTAETAVGKSVPLGVVREGRELRLTVKIAELREEKASEGGGDRAVSAPSLGMQVDELSEQLRLQAGIEEGSGVVVTEIEPGGSAEEAGIEAGDVIKEVNRKPVKDLAEYQAALSHAKQGTPLLLLLRRGKQTLFASLEAR